jgi:hypothetical protein
MDDDEWYVTPRDPELLRRRLTDVGVLRSLFDQASAGSPERGAFASSLAPAIIAALAELPAGDRRRSPLARAVCTVSRDADPSGVVRIACAAAHWHLVRARYEGGSTEDRWGVPGEASGDDHLAQAQSIERSLDEPARRAAGPALLAQLDDVRTVALRLAAIPSERLTPAPVAGDVMRAGEDALAALSTLAAEDPAAPPLRVQAALGAVLRSVGLRSWTPEAATMLAQLEQLAHTEPLDIVARTLLQIARIVVRTMMATTHSSAQNVSSTAFDTHIAEGEASLKQIAGLDVPDDVTRPVTCLLHTFSACLLVFRSLAEPNAVPEETLAWTDVRRTWPAPDEDGVAFLRRATDHLEAAGDQALPQLRPLIDQLHVVIRLCAAGPWLDDETLSGFEQLERDYPQVWDALGGDLPGLVRRVQSAHATGDPNQLREAAAAIGAARERQPAGSGLQVALLSMLAQVLGMLAALTRSATDAAAALEAAINALDVSATPALGVLYPLSATLVTSLQLDRRTGPYQQVEYSLDRVLADPPADSESRLAARIARAAAGRAVQRQQPSITARRTPAKVRQDLDSARHELDSLLARPAAGPERAVLGVQLLQLEAFAAGSLGDAEAASGAVAVIDLLMPLLRAEPETAAELASHLAVEPGRGPAGPDRLLRLLTDQRAALMPLAVRSHRVGHQPSPGSPPPSFQPGAPPSPADEASPLAGASDVLMLAQRVLGYDVRRPLAPGGPPGQEVMKALQAVDAAIARGVVDTHLRRDLLIVSGECHAELHWISSAADDGHVDAAIQRLKVAFATGAHSIPTAARADAHEVLARCYRVHGCRPGGSSEDRRRAVTSARAALRELGRCILVAPGPAVAFGMAARAQDLLHIAVAWCLDDADPAMAVALAEEGRGMTLAAAILSGRVEQVLRDVVSESAADGWRSGSERGRLEGLARLSESPEGLIALMAPAPDDVAATLTGAGLDAVIYLIPSSNLETPGRALVVRHGFSVDAVELAGLSVEPASPIARYLDALAGALAADGSDRSEDTGSGFRGGVRGRAWAAELDRLGQWLYPTVVEPVMTAVDPPHGGGPRRIGLIPLGELGAVPWSVAWRPDPAAPGGRRYAIHDLVLHQAASARLLAAAAVRPRRRAEDRPVFVVPTGDLLRARIAAATIATQILPAARVLGPRGEAPATSERLLEELLGPEPSSASLLHLFTHASGSADDPLAGVRLQTQDGWLPIADILTSASSRNPASSGALVICDACVTDVTFGHQDESLTMATAFLAAGAAGVVGTRWPVDDDAAAVLTYAFHLRLAAGSAPGEALRDAQLWMIDPDRTPLPGLPGALAVELQPGRFAEPASWAGYVYHGS